MSQSLLKLRAGKIEIERIFELLESEFEDDGYGMAISEIDEATDVHEFSIYLPIDDAVVIAVRDRINDRLGSDSFGITIEREDLADIDWVRKSLEGLKPVRAGRFLVHGAHDRGAVRPSDIAIEIDAGQAFGTGHHGTTSGCLIQIEKLLRTRKPKRSLDLGAGSAVLAIAIAKLSRTPVLATDIDPVAVKVARENIALNGEKGLVACETAIGFRHSAFREQGPFDLIVANILPWPLMAMALDIQRNLAVGGDVILSGILTHQRNMVLAKFRNVGLNHRSTIEREGWVTIHLARGGAAQRMW
ncbi:MAG: 50S ribosomal protein L11 methyltransferase [Ahrensia sp.]|nr:50S ribosomal protein L11 methyltransferase [Ahrensia sp.]